MEGENTMNIEAIICARCEREIILFETSLKCTSLFDDIFEGRFLG
jgi:hypothetical protein